MPVGGHADRLQLEGDLLGVGAAAKSPALIAARALPARKSSHSVITGDELVARRPGAAVELGGGRGEHAAALEHAAREVGEPRLADGVQPGQPGAPRPCDGAMTCSTRISRVRRSTATCRSAFEPNAVCTLLFGTPRRSARWAIVEAFEAVDRGELHGLAQDRGAGPVAARTASVDGTSAADGRASACKQDRRSFVYIQRMNHEDDPLEDFDRREITLDGVDEGGARGRQRPGGDRDDGDAGHQPARRALRPLGARRGLHRLHAVAVRPRRRGAGASRRASPSSSARASAPSSARSPPTSRAR